VPAVNDYAWPDDLPNGCPPDSATPAEGTFFRFINKRTPSAKDFVRPIDRPNADFSPKEQCAAAALSLYADPNDVTLAQRFIPGFKKKKVAQGALVPHMGVIENTPCTQEGVQLESHHDWWVATGYTDLPLPFVLVTL
jgi:hypothetical protein